MEWEVLYEKVEKLLENFKYERGERYPADTNLPKNINRELMRLGPKVAESFICLSLSDRPEDSVEGAGMEWRLMELGYMMSMLTANDLKPSFSRIEELCEKGYGNNVFNHILDNQNIAPSYLQWLIRKRADSTDINSKGRALGLEEVHIDRAKNIVSFFNKLP